MGGAVSGPRGAPAWVAGCTKTPAAHARIGKNEADGVVDASCGEFIRIEEQRSDGETGGVGAGALFSAARRRIDAVEIPYRDESAR